MKLFAQIHSLKEITKGNYLIDIEIVSLDNDGILPNKDFIIKAGITSKNRTTNNEGFYRNDDFFESKEPINEILLFDTNQDLISKYFLPLNRQKSNILNNKSLIYAEIQSLIIDCKVYFTRKSKKNGITTIYERNYFCDKISQNGGLTVKKVKKDIIIVQGETDDGTSFLRTDKTIENYLYSLSLENDYSISEINILNIYNDENSTYHFEIYGSFNMTYSKETEKSGTHTKKEITKSDEIIKETSKIYFTSYSQKTIKRLRELLEQIKQST